jgi:hypothetical protein
MVESRRAIKVFYSYAHADSKWRERLNRHLEVLQRQGRIAVWDNSAIQPGTEWKKEIDHQLSTSDLILLLLSDHYLTSHFCSTVEMAPAIELNERGKARTIPILLSPVNWENTPLSTLHALPSNGIPITQWSKIEEALTTTAEEIGQIIDEMLA